MADTRIAGKRDAETEHALQVIPRISLKDKAIMSIREAIERGELRSGEVVTELGLARKLGVGQPTIREALLELEFLGFIERTGPRKTRVTLLTRKTIHDIYQVRELLETLAAKLVVGDKQVDLKPCWDAALRMEVAARSGDAYDFYQSDLAFHRGLWHAAGNESLASCLELLVPRLMTFSIIQKARPTSSKLLEIAGVHRKLLETIASGNLKETVRLMSSSMKNAQEDDESLPGLD